MAEAIVGIAGEIISILGPQAIETVGKLWGVKQELKALKDTVSMLQPVLDHAEEQYHQTPRVRVWVEKLKDAFYEAQDILEEFNIEAIRRELRGNNEMIKEVRTFFSSSNQLAFKLKMSNKVRAVRERIQAIKAERKFHLDERRVDLQIEREWRNREETHSFIRDGDIIGRDDDKKTVMDFLLDSDVKEDVSILPIVGIGGLGKTALAQCVYNDEMVSKQFNLKMWVCVSDNFDVKKIVKDMLACAQKKQSTEDTMDRLQSELRGEIDGKRYLLVLDDLWNVERETWLSLKTLLLGGARGSKILITTRLPLVARITGTAPHHPLGGLYESASLKLLMQMACSNEEEKQDPKLLDIGKDIVQKCYGVPLVVRTIGGLLFQKSEHEWSQFIENELPDLSQREDGIKLVLKLSYDHLPSHLKQCFAFCSLFPKDYEIKKQTLVDLWVAEGFILPSPRNQHLEDIAHIYFMDLLWSNFFQDFKKDPDTDEEICKMHDLMHDLACSVAGAECWVAWDDQKPILERTHHISHDSTSNLMDKLPISILKIGALRTFLSTTRDWELTREVDLRQLIQSFKRLRILDLHGTNVEKVPRSICKLKHLTYLDLSWNCALKRLPKSITRLQNLQILILLGCESLEELPRDIRKLVSLRNLDIDGCDRLSYMPHGLGQLSSLHRLTRFILPERKTLVKNYCRLGELNGLNNIQGSLRIENLGSVIDAAEESKAANLIGKHSLKSLELVWGDFHTDDVVIGERDEALLNGLRPPSKLQELMIRGYKGRSFPMWMRNASSLPNLVELRLECLECLPNEECLKSHTALESLTINHCPRLTSLSSLGVQHLSNLARLVIWSCEELDLSKDESGNILYFHGGLLQSLRSVRLLGLPKLESLPRWLLQLNNLESLHISWCSNLKELPEQIGDLQSLQRLGISFCPSLTSLPEGIRRLASLPHLNVFRCPELEERCTRDGGEDWYKIAHIPHITHNPFFTQNY